MVDNGDISRNMEYMNEEKNFLGSTFGILFNPSYTCDGKY